MVSFLLRPLKQVSSMQQTAPDVPVRAVLAPDGTLRIEGLDEARRAHAQLGTNRPLQLAELPIVAQGDGSTIAWEYLLSQSPRYFLKIEILIPKN
jgi:hypothetical protein